MHRNLFFSVYFDCYPVTSSYLSCFWQVIFISNFKNFHSSQAFWMDQNWYLFLKVITYSWSIWIINPPKEQIKLSMSDTYICDCQFTLAWHIACMGHSVNNVSLLSLPQNCIINYQPLYPSFYFGINTFFIKILKEKVEVMCRGKHFKITLKECLWNLYAILYINTLGTYVFKFL